MECFRKGRVVIQTVVGADYRRACVRWISRLPAMAQAPLSVPPSATVAATPYRINPGDELEVLVWGDERLQRDVLVLPDGTFAFPLVGQVNAAGRLPSEIERVITAGLQPQYKGPVPQVTVSVKKPSGYQFSVIGKVRSPGTFTPGRYVNALEALAIAGGPSEFANTGSARVIRKAGDRLYVVPVRIQDALRGDTARLNPTIFRALRAAIRWWSPDGRALIAAQLLGGASQTAAPSSALAATSTASRVTRASARSTYVDLEGGAGYSTNPNLRFGDNTGSALRPRLGARCSHSGQRADDDRSFGVRAGTASIPSH